MTKSKMQEKAGWFIFWDVLFIATVNLCPMVSLFKLLDLLARLAGFVFS
jgi:hypothetical protein